MTRAEFFPLYDAYRAWRKIVARRYNVRTWGRISNPFRNPLWPSKY